MKIRLIALFMALSFGASAQYTPYGNGSVQRQVSGSDTTFRWVGSAVGNYLYGKSLDWQKKNFNTILASSISFATVAQMQAYSGSATSFIVTDRFRGGLWKYDNSGTYTTDGGTIVSMPGKGGGVALRVMDNGEGVRPEWFVAEPFVEYDPETGAGTDMSAATQAAINSSVNRNSEVLFSYKYKMNDSVKVGDGTVLTGINASLKRQISGLDTIKYQIKSGLFFVNNTNGIVNNLDTVHYRSQWVRVEKLGVFGTGKNNGKSAILFRDNPNSTVSRKIMGGPTVSGCFIADFTYGIDMNGQADGPWVNKNHVSETKVAYRAGTGESKFIENVLYNSDTAVVTHEYHGIYFANEIAMTTAETPNTVGIYVKNQANEGYPYPNGITISTNVFGPVGKAIIFEGGRYNQIINNNFESMSDTTLVLRNTLHTIVQGNQFVNQISDMPNVPFIYANGTDATTYIGNRFRSSPSFRNKVGMELVNATNNSLGSQNIASNVKNGLMISSGTTSFVVDSLKGNVAIAGNLENSGSIHANGKVSTGVFPTGSSTSQLSASGTTAAGNAIASEGVAVNSNLVMRRANGSVGSLSNILVNDNIGSLTWEGYLDGSYFGRAAIETFATENWASGAKGTAITLSNTPSGSNTRTVFSRMTNGRTYFGGNSNASAILHLAAGTATASTAPLKFTSGTLLGTAEAGAIEFLSDKLYATITTGAARKEITLNDVALNSGIVPVTTTNGRLTNTTVTAVELGYLSGVTSSLQAQLNAKGAGTVTSFGKTDGYGIISSVANSTTTPNHTIAVDTTSAGGVVSKSRLASAISSINTSSGTYTPTLTNGTNVSSTTPVQCMYTRIGNTVTVTGSLAYTPSGTNSGTTISISLPVASNLANAYELSGYGEGDSSSSVSHATITGNTASDIATLTFINGLVVSSQNLFFSFTYKVI